MSTDHDVFVALKRRADAGELKTDEPLLKGDTSPLDVQTLAAVEATLGRPLPSLLFRIYSEIQNGGFGDSYGFLGLVGGPTNEFNLDAIGLWKACCEPNPNDDFWDWPKHLLPIGHLGCGMYHCIDCSTQAGAIVLFEPNPHEDEEPWDDAFFAVCPSLADYLDTWLRGENIWEVFPPQPIA
ncbi:SMI1/KNR4 family protein [Aeoliella mucimassa]|uniref:SMI1 / KNR4 family protein n=1 Tax=Aeoliella mucimassa TaxID=2527972 RepID=A0A518AHG3_9BACT|nr:SMI1/KNR4 family protein [Aeoliella mucimassa]QDU54135.1 SMI1 / KNR4 family protein [Aeoliella mucimassa]